MTEAEFDRMVRTYGKDILRFCLMETGDRDLGDELYQDTMLTLWEQKEKLDSDSNVKSYALSVSIHIWKNRKRKYARRMRIVPQESYEQHIEFGEIGKLSDDSLTNPEERLLCAERAERVRRAVNSLHEKYRLVIYLYYTAELTAKETAECLHIPENTVRSRLRKAKKILKERLEAEEYDR